MANPVAPTGGTYQDLGWYPGVGGGSFQYYKGTWGANGAINPNSPQQGAGQKVSNEVVAQTNPANVPYLANTPATATPPSGGQPSAQGAGASPTDTGGGGTGGVSMPSAPTFDVVAATKAAYETPEIIAAQKAITDRQQALADAQTNINDNPFYSEATRTGKLSKLETQANNDIKVQQDKLTMLNADAQIKLNAQTQQYNINNDAYKTNLSNFNNLVSQGALDNASASDIANLSIQTGIPTSMIQSIAKAQSQKDNPVSMIQSTDNQGNLTLLAVDKNGKIVNQTTIAGAGKSTTSGTAADKKISDEQANTQNAAAAAKAGAQLKELVDHYGSVLSIDQIYQIYNSNATDSITGQRVTAKESLDSVKQGRYANVANSGWQPATTK
jgi:hypothetical protein